ncbi:MAG: histidine phosphatase family protein [bacterium]|nr:histidine phosphatase family protein [bacterium]
MKRSLYIMRHGKSDWTGETGDHGRTLNERGRNDARRLGAWLASIEQEPDRVLTSSAERAIQTTRGLVEAGGFECPVVVEPTLYMTSVDGALAVLRAQPSEVGHLLVVGHEPTSSELCSALIGGASIRFPTAALARLDFRKSAWSDLQLKSCQLHWFVTPKAFPTNP